MNNLTYIYRNKIQQSIIALHCITKSVQIHFVCPKLKFCEKILFLYKLVHFFIPSPSSKCVEID